MVRRSRRVPLPDRRGDGGMMTGRVVEGRRDTWWCWRMGEGRMDTWQYWRMQEGRIDTLGCWRKGSRQAGSKSC